MEQYLLGKIYIDENDDVQIEIPDVEEFVLNVTDSIKHAMSEGEKELLNILYAITVHLLASENSGVLEQDYYKNLKKTVKVYREAYQKGTSKRNKYVN